MTSQEEVLERMKEPPTVMTESLEREYEGKFTVPQESRALSLTSSGVRWTLMPAQWRPAWINFQTKRSGKSRHATRKEVSRPADLLSSRGLDLDGPLAVFLFDLWLRVFVKTLSRILKFFDIFDSQDRIYRSDSKQIRHWIDLLLRLFWILSLFTND